MNIYAPQRSMAPVVIFALAIASAIAVSYFVVGRDMMFLIEAIGGAVLFFVCFTSVRISLFILVLSMLFSPEVMIGATAKREITVRLEDIILLIMTVSWLFRMAIFKDLGFMLKTPLNGAMAAYSAIAVASTALGVWRGNVEPMAGMFFTLKLIEYFFVYNVIVNNVRTEKDVHELLNLLILVFGVISLYGLYQVVSGGTVEAPFEYGAGERNTLSGYLVLMGSVCGALLLHTESGSERRVMGVMLSVAMVVLVFSLSRSGWIACTISVAVLFFSTGRSNILLLLVCVGLLLLPYMIPEVIQQRWMYTFNQPSEAGQFALFGIKLDTSTSDRIFSALQVGRDFINHPFLGYGVTGYWFIDGQFIRTFVEMGLLGLTALIWLLIGVYRIIRRTIRTVPSSRLKAMTIGFHAGFCGLMFHALTANTFIIIRIAEPFWCLTGLTVVALTLAQKAEESRDASTVPSGADDDTAKERLPWQQAR